MGGTFGDHKQLISFPIGYDFSEVKGYAQAFFQSEKMERFGKLEKEKEMRLDQMRIWAEKFGWMVQMIMGGLEHWDFWVSDTCITEE